MSIVEGYPWCMFAGPRAWDPEHCEELLAAVAPGDTAAADAALIPAFGTWVIGRDSVRRRGAGAGHAAGHGRSARALHRRRRRAARRRASRRPAGRPRCVPHSRRPAAHDRPARELAADRARRPGRARAAHDRRVRKGGRERYPIVPDLRERLASALRDAEDPQTSRIVRAVRLYLDICYLHPFADGNARAARLALDHLLTRYRHGLHAIPAEK